MPQPTPPARPTPQPIPPIPQLKPPTQIPPQEPVLEQTQQAEVMALYPELFVGVKQLDLDALEEVHTTSTSREEMVTAEESNILIFPETP